MVSKFDRIDAYQIINKSILNVVRDMVTVTPAELPTPTYAEQHRMFESTFSVAEKSQRVAQAVVAHNLNQYVNKFYQIEITESVECYLDYLIDIDYDDIDIAELGGNYDEH